MTAPASLLPPSIPFHLYHPTSATTYMSTQQQMYVRSYRLSPANPVEDAQMSPCENAEGPREDSLRASERVKDVPNTQSRALGCCPHPRDHKTPLIQKLAKQACVTYRVLKSSADVADSQSELMPLLTTVRAADLKITPRKSKPCSVAAGLQSPPVTYMHICETEVFSMGLFLLRPGASIPLHDQPDMNGNLRSC
ncbi:unnamed protein product [Pleuronectes platessa]|uniref:Uncharacterized protein n=1 Tax=Pleuronectes platessa TaxID=8262 RepID=A0A9N7UH33_PLEPL|nr:unnamed protein product [Pleuronectes platessa]